MSTFMWLEGVEDIDPIAKELNMPREKLKEILTGNMHDEKYTVFHTGTGDKRELLRDTCSKYPRAYLERLFMEDLYDKAEIVWENPYGLIISTEDFVVFHLWATISDVLYQQKIVIPLEDLTGVLQRTYDQQYRDVLDRLVRQIDLNVKIHRYGPMPLT